MCPDKIERLRRRKLLRVAGIESLMDIPCHAGNIECLAYVAGRAAAGHGVEHHAGAEEREQVLDELAAAIARPFPVAVFACPVEVIKAGQMRDRASGFRCLRQAGVDRPVRLRRPDRGGTAEPGGVVRIDRCG